jgi:hypothetical protein
VENEESGELITKFFGGYCSEMEERKDFGFALNGSPKIKWIH